MSKLPSALPDCGHGNESTTFLFLYCEIGLRHHEQCLAQVRQLEKLFVQSGTGIRLETWISVAHKCEPETYKLSDVLPPKYRLSLGCAAGYQRLAEQTGRLLSVDELLAFIGETLL